MQALAQELRSFIVETFMFGEEVGDFAFSDEDSFIERGIVDSTGILELVAYVQARYDIPIDDEELVPENLDSIERLARFISRKRIAATR